MSKDCLTIRYWILGGRDQRCVWFYPGQPIESLTWLGHLQTLRQFIEHVLSSDCAHHHPSCLDVVDADARQNSHMSKPLSHDSPLDVLNAALKAHGFKDAVVSMPCPAIEGAKRETP